MTRRSLLTFMFLGAAIACGDNESPTSPTPPPVTGSAPFSTTDLVVGTGTEATPGHTVVVDYTGWFYSDTAADHKGNQFDSSSGQQPFSFVLGTGNVIQGWHQGIAGMRVGGRRRIVIPPDLAYGASGYRDIPPNATLLFDVELLAVQ